MADNNEKLQELLNTTDTTDQFDPSDIERNKVMGILAYLSWLVLIPLFAAKDSKFARYHVNQGLVLAIVESVVGDVLGFFGRLPLIGRIFGLVNGLFGLVCIIMSIIGIINAVTGKAKELPIIGQFKLIK